MSLGGGSWRIHVSTPGSRTTRGANKEEAPLRLHNSPNLPEIHLDFESTGGWGGEEKLAFLVSTNSAPYFDCDAGDDTLSLQRRG